MSLNFLIQDISMYIFIFCRLAGMIAFNPILSRNQMPAQLRAGLILGLVYLIKPTLDPIDVSVMNDYMYTYTMLIELFIGYIWGYIFYLFYYMLFAVGDIIDMGFGLSMAKAFDPGTNIQISMSGNIFQIMFVLYFFITNCHLVFFKMITTSFDFVSIGAASFNQSIIQLMASLLTSSFALIMQLAVPFMASSFILEMSMGMLMKLIPQINVFVINFQFKIILGMTLLYLFAEPTSAFLLNYMNKMLVTMQNVIYMF